MNGVLQPQHQRPGPGWRPVLTAATAARRVLAAAALALTLPALHVTPAVAADEGFCQDYASIAVRQARAAHARPDCRQSAWGGRWSENYFEHFQWCLTVPPQAADQERALRADHLRRCGNHEWWAPVRRHDWREGEHPDDPRDRARLERERLERERLERERGERDHREPEHGAAPMPGVIQPSQPPGDHPSGGGSAPSHGSPSGHASQGGGAAHGQTAHGAPSGGQRAPAAPPHPSSGTASSGAQTQSPHHHP